MYSYAIVENGSTSHTFTPSPFSGDFGASGDGMPAIFGGSWYSVVILKDGSTFKFQAMVSTAYQNNDVGVIWHELDSGNRPASTSNKQFGYYDQSDDFITVGYRNDGTGMFICNAFSMITGLWGTPTSDSAIDTTLYQVRGMGVKSNGDIIVFFSDFSGTANLSFTIHDAVGDTWSAPVLVDAGSGAFGYVNVDRSNDCATFLYTIHSNPSKLVGVFDDSTFTAVISVGYTNKAGIPSVGRIFNGKVYYAYTGTDGHLYVVVTDSSTLPSSTSVIDTGINQSAMGNGGGTEGFQELYVTADGGTLGAIFTIFNDLSAVDAAYSSDQLYQTTSGDGTTWSAATLLFDGAGTDFSPPSALTTTAPTSGAGTGQIASCSDLGSGTVGMMIWIFSNPTGKGAIGTLVPISTSGTINYAY